MQSQIYLNYAEREQVRCRNLFATAKVLHFEKPFSFYVRLLPIMQDNAVFCQLSISNFSQINFTIWGGRTFAVGDIPILVSSFLKGAHQFISVLTDTPAQSASCDFDIDFITFKLLKLLKLLNSLNFLNFLNFSLFTSHFSPFTFHFLQYNPPNLSCVLSAPPWRGAPVSQSS